MTAAEIDEGAIEVAYEVAGYTRRPTPADAFRVRKIIAAYLAALPAPASGAAEMRERAVSMCEEWCETALTPEAALHASQIAEAIRALPLAEPGSKETHND